MAAENEAAAECGSVMEIVAEVSAPAIYESGVQDYRKVTESIKAAALAIVADAETAKGRKELRSVAYAVARSKTLLDGMGKELVADLKEKAKRVDLIRKGIRDELDELKNEVLAPVDAWEGRVRAVEDRINSIGALGEIRMGESADQIRARIMRLEEIDGEEIDSMGRDEELAAEVKTAMALLNDALEQKVKYEAEQAELAKLREEKARRDAEDAKRKADEERKAREQAIAEAAAAKARAEALAEKAKTEPVQQRTEPVRVEITGSSSDLLKREIEDSILEWEELSDFVRPSDEITFAATLAMALMMGEIANVQVVGWEVAV